MSDAQDTSRRECCTLLAVILFATAAAASSDVIRLPTAGPRCPADDPAEYSRPVIGIVSHPGDGTYGRVLNDSTASYIASSYVKFVESAGARVIPLIYNEPQEAILQKLELVNGVLFTGGSANTGVYFDTIKKLFETVLAKNDAGEHFPLLAICLGFELVTMLVSKNNSILESFNARNQASSLQFLPDAIIKNSLFERYPPDLLEKLSIECLVMQDHMFGISPSHMQENDELSSFFKILTTSADKDGKVYVSTVQSYKYPVTGLQWHPEKNIFEWAAALPIPHSEDAIRVAQHAANYFISKARKSTNRPPAASILANLIYNYKPTFAGTAGKGYDEVYIFTQDL